MSNGTRDSLNAQLDDSARQRGELTANLVPIAANLAWRVRDEGRESVGELLASLSPRQRWALLVVLAAMVDVDRRTDELLAWMTFDEYGRPLPENPSTQPTRQPRPARLRSCGRATATTDGRPPA